MCTFGHIEIQHCTLFNSRCIAQQNNDYILRGAEEIHYPVEETRVFISLLGQDYALIKFAVRATISFFRDKSTAARCRMPRRVGMSIWRGFQHRYLSWSPWYSDNRFLITSHLKCLAAADIFAQRVAAAFELSAPLLPRTVKPSPLLSSVPLALFPLLSLFLSRLDIQIMD